MLAVNYTNFRENMKEYMDKATNDYETLIVTQKYSYNLRTRVCLKNHSYNLYTLICGIFCPHSVDVARYAALIRTKSPTNYDAHIAESIFQTHSRT